MIVLIKYFSSISWQWEILNNTIIEQLCNTKSLLEYWENIINDKCPAVEKAFLITVDGNIEGFYHKRLFSNIEDTKNA